MRRSLEAITGAPAYDAENGLTVRNGSKVYCRHFGAERLKAIAGYFGDTLVANSLEETESAFNKYRQLYPGPGMEESIAHLFQGE